MKRFFSIVLVICIVSLTFSLSAQPVTAEDDSYPHLTAVPEGYIGIYTKEDLNKIRKNMRANYILMNDIVFEASDFSEGGDFYNDGKGWIPIASPYEDSFWGIFDGNGYSIENLYILIPEDAESPGNAGLFGSVGGKIMNLFINTNTDIKAADYSCGTITGENKGTIENCMSTGILYSYDRSGSCAGISGNNLGTISNCINYSYIFGNDKSGGISGYNEGNINKCYNGGLISNPETYTDFSYSYNSFESGGIAGRNHFGIISECYNTGIIYFTTSSSIRTGGIAGLNSGSIANCFNTASITSINDSNCVSAGGISGYNLYNSNYNEGGDVNFCYNIGSLNIFTNGNDRNITGAISGRNSKDNLCSYCYYLKSDIKDVGSGTGSNQLLTLTEMKNPNSFKDFDFDSVWTTSDNSRYPFPVLKSVPIVYIGKNGDINNDFQITAADALLVLQYSVNKIELDQIQTYLSDIDINDEVTAADALLILQAAVGKVIII